MFRLLIGHRMHRNATGCVRACLTRHRAGGGTARGIHGLTIIVRWLIAGRWGATGQLVAAAGMGRRPRIGLFGVGHVWPMWPSGRARVGARRRGIGGGSVGLLLALIITSSSLTGSGDLVVREREAKGMRAQVNREKMSEALLKHF